MCTPNNISEFAKGTETNYTFIKNLAQLRFKNQRLLDEYFNYFALLLSTVCDPIEDMIFTIHKISLTGQFDAMLLVKHENLFTGESFPFTNVYERNIGNDANPDQVIDGAPTVPEEFAPSSESECLFIMICADDSSCRRVLKTMKLRKCLFHVLIRFFRFRQTSETSSFDTRKTKSMIILWEE
jgi:hypothetical protein